MTTPATNHLPAADPHPRGAARFLGRACGCNVAPGRAPARRVAGVVEAARYLGRTARGEIPDYWLTVRGKSGALVEVSLVENYVSFPHPDFPL